MKDNLHFLETKLLTSSGEERHTFLENSASIECLLNDIDDPVAIDKLANSLYDIDEISGVKLFILSYPNASSKNGYHREADAIELFVWEKMPNPEIARFLEMLIDKTEDQRLKRKYMEWLGADYP